MRSSTIGVLILLSQARAHAEVDARRAISSDAFATIAVRPVGVSGALRRIGSGWETMVRKTMRIPQAVAPLEPGVVSALGIDPAATAWAGVRMMRGGMHLRVAVPLENERIAEALVQTASSVLGIQMTRTPQGAWHRTTIAQDGAVVRLDGKLLVADLYFSSDRKMTSAELQRVVPLRPPKSFGLEHGAARRIGPSTALAIWLDLSAAIQSGLALAEKRVRVALVGVDPSLRGKLMAKGNEEITNCRNAARALPPTFEDMLFSVGITGPDELHVELTLGGKKTSLDPLRARDSTQRATRGLAEALGDAELTAAIIEPILPRLLAPAPATQVVSNQTVSECGWAGLPLVLRSWPTVLASRVHPTPTAGTGTALRPQARGTSEDLVHFLSGVRGAAIALPIGEKDAGSAMMRQLSAVLEVDPAERGDLDRALLGNFGAVTPLKLATRQVTTYGLPSFPWSQGEGPIVAVDVLPSTPAATLVGFGPRETIRQVFDRIGPASAPARTPGSVAMLQVSERGLTRLLREAIGQGELASTLVDGVKRIDAEVVIEPTWLRVDASFGLRPGATPP